MKNASSSERLSGTTGNGGSSPTDLARRVKNLFTGSSPLNKKRSMSLDELDSKPAASVMFGVPLTDLCQRESSAVPFLVRRIVKHIEDVGLDQEGIYRINGNTRIIDKLKMDFNRDGNANFGDVEIHAISSLLKLFLRELPDGVVPRDFVPHFAGVQQSYPSEASPEALNKLKGSIRLLPTTNYNMLNYLIQHLTRVAKHSDRNKMTPVSLSIVFGPNIFPCGSGIEALKTQGYCNATTCRLIQNYRTLFDRRRGQKREPPEKPMPYIEHKRQKTEAPSAEPADTATGSTHDLEGSHSERSIDEAIERSSGTLSPLSPTPMPVEEAKPKASPPPPASPPKSSSPLMVEPYQGEGRVKKLSLGRSKSLDSGSSDEVLVASSDEANTNTGGVEQSFHRQYAKRGMRFKARLSEGSISQRPPLGSPSAGGDQVVVLRHPHLNVLNSREEEMRTPSPYSWQSSPGTSPPTSPVLTPRSSRVVSSVIEDTIKNFLFQSSAPLEPSNKTLHEGSPDKIKDKNKILKADVYGLLLPEADSSVQKEFQPKPAAGEPVQRRHTVAGNQEVVMRRTKKTRNRKSAIYGESDDLANNSNDSKTAATASANKTKSPIHDMKVKLVSFSPENSIDKGDESSDGVLETRQGKVSDLVKQFEVEEKATEAKQQSNGSTGGESNTKEAQNNESEEKEKGKKKRPTSKAFDMFEKSGMIMGMGGPSSHSKPRAVSFALEVSTIPASTSSSTSSINQSPEESRDSPRTMDGSRDSPRAADGSRGGSRATEGSRGSSRATLTTLGSTIAGSEDLTTASKDFLSVSTCDEDVFTSPSHSQRTSTSSSVSPSHGKQQQRDHLSTTASDDVFVSPVHAATNQSVAEESTDGGSSELDAVKRSESTLEHLTLSRPRGPVARKKPRRASAPISSQVTPATSSNTAGATTNKGEVKVLITTVEQTPEKNIKEAALPKDDDMKSEWVVQKVTPSSATVGQVAQPEQVDERTKVNRTRTKSAPEVNEKVDASLDQPADKKKTAKNVSLNVGEDTTDGGEQRRRRSSQKNERTGILKGSGSTSRQKRKHHTVADIEQLRTSDSGGVEVTHGAVPAVMSKMPLVDLTSLAPEKQQAVGQVTEGWKEKEGTPTTAEPTATSSLRDIVQRIHELKSEIRKFEDDFTTKHGHKPSSTEKSPIGTQLEELSRLRKQYKELKEKEKVSEGSAKDEPDHAVITVAPLQTDIGREVVSPKLQQGSQATSNESGSVDRNPTTASVVGGSRPRAATIGALPSSKESAEKPRDTTKSASLQQNLDKIMAGLDTRRKSAGRPDDMTLMTKEQALQEKQMIQKALLSFEKTFGRPQTKSDKEVIKPLYDRYRQIKKLCSGDFRKESHDSVSTLTPRLSLPGALESTNDSLPSVTLLQQSTMAKSLPSAPSGYTNPDEPHSKSAFDLLKSPSTTEPRRATISAHPTELLMGDKQLESASIEEMKCQKELFLARKKELRIILKEFESTFVGLHGRNVMRADRKPMQNEYDEYKSIKTRLLTVDNLLKKADPQKTI